MSSAIFVFVREISQLSVLKIEGELVDEEAGEEDVLRAGQENPLLTLRDRGLARAIFSVVNFIRTLLSPKCALYLIPPGNPYNFSTMV